MWKQNKWVHWILTIKERKKRWKKKELKLKWKIHEKKTEGNLLWVNNFKQASQAVKLFLKYWNLKKSINLIDRDYFEPQVKVYNSKMMLLLHQKVNTMIKNSWIFHYEKNIQFQPKLMTQFFRKTFGRVIENSNSNPYLFWVCNFCII